MGCVRTSLYQLPKGDHEFGLKKPKDPENAGQLISNWVTSDPSEMKKQILSHEFPGLKPKPAQIEKQYQMFLSNREIQTNIDRIKISF